MSKRCIDPMTLKMAIAINNMSENPKSLEDVIDEEPDAEVYMELLKAKDAIFRLIGQFHRASKFDDGELYIYDYCESALERAFTVLGIEEDYIKLMDFCQLWENNNRAIWAINIPDMPYGMATAEGYYDIFKKDYELWEKQLEELDEEE